MSEAMETGKGKTLRYVIVGGGMAGILAAIRLKQRGETEVVLYEKADSLGGTWRDNQYPGLTCDVPAHAYTYSFAPNPDWSAFYAGGPEIKAYFEGVAERYGIMPWVRFNSEVAGCVYDEASHQWEITLANGTKDRADVAIVASGVLHHPKTPDIPGLASFEGDCFHSARWDHSVPIDGKRFGVIGCGSTGVQIVTALSTRCEKLVHFQRSPQWIMPVPFFEYSEEDRQAFREDLKKIDDIRYGEEYWSGIRRFTRAVTDVDGPEMAEIEAVVLQNLEQSVRDPVLREKLRPNYRAACKRLIYSWSYYEAAQAPAVFVETGGIERVEPKGVRMKDGSFHELDALVLATGFHADRFIRPATVSGRGGVSLDDVWSRRPTAYYAVTIPNFPNFFMLNGPTGPVGNFSLIDIAERQWDYIDQLIDQLRAGTHRAVEPRQEAMDDYDARRIDAAKKTIFGSGCTSWYLDAEGVPASWPWSYEAFSDAMRAPELKDYLLHA